MTAKEIAATLAANSISYERGFADLATYSYATPECRELSDKIVESLSEIVSHGVNNGFTGSMEKAIDRLTEMCVSLTTRNAKAQKQLPKIRDNFAEVRGRVDLTMRTPDREIKQNVIKHIDKELEGIQYMREELERDTYLDERDREHRIAEKDKQIASLKELRDIVSKVIDNASVDAGNIAYSIVDELIRAGDMVVHNQDRNVLNVYATAIEKAKQWAERRRAVQTKNVAKEGAVLYEPEADPLAVIAMSMEVESDIRNFRANLEAFRRRKEERASVQKYFDQMKDLQNEINDLEKQKKDWYFAVKSGTMTTMEFQRLVQRADHDIARRRQKIQQIEMRCNSVTNVSDLSEDVIFKIDNIATQLEDISEDSRIVLYMVGKSINFITLDKIMRGDPVTKEEMDHMVHMTSTITAATEEEQNTYMRIFNQMQNTEQVIDSTRVNVERAPLGGQQVADPLRAQENAANDFFAQFEAQMGNGAAADQGLPEMEDESPLHEGIDDILTNDR